VTGQHGGLESDPGRWFGHIVPGTAAVGRGRGFGVRVGLTLRVVCAILAGAIVTG
jgi:hypothetical protein